MEGTCVEGIRVTREHMPTRIGLVSTSDLASKQTKTPPARPRYHQVNAHAHTLDITIRETNIPAVPPRARPPAPAAARKKARNHAPSPPWHSPFSEACRQTRRRRGGLRGRVGKGSPPSSLSRYCCPRLPHAALLRNPLLAASTQRPPYRGAQAAPQRRPRSRRLPRPPPSQRLQRPPSRPQLRCEQPTRAPSPSWPQSSRQRRGAPASRGCVVMTPL